MCIRDSWRAAVALVTLSGSVLAGAAFWVRKMAATAAITSTRATPPATRPMSGPLRLFFGARRVVGMAGPAYVSGGAEGPLGPDWGYWGTPGLGCTGC